ncbi:MAG: hypothetical protein PHT59_00530 [Candidatus Omnitrophica bacterium]|nr:hypothetical protein [Candidatus Omnitrophota bacterium]
MRSEDERQLGLLSIFHKILGILVAVFSCMFIFHLVIGIISLVNPGALGGNNNPPPAMFGWLFLIMGSAAILLGWSLGVCMFLAGKYLTERTHYKFCFGVAIASCLVQPFGTVLGIFTIIVLSRLSVKALFSQTPLPAG